MEKHNKLENEKEEVQVNDKDGYKKSPIIRPRIKRKFRLEALEARKKNFNSKFGDGCELELGNRSFFLRRLARPRKAP